MSSALFRHAVEERLGFAQGTWDGTSQDTTVTPPPAAVRAINTQVESRKTNPQQNHETFTELFLSISEPLSLGAEAISEF